MTAAETVNVADKLAVFLGAGFMLWLSKRKILYSLALIAALSAYFVESIGKREFQLPLLALAAALAFWGHSSASREDFDD